jgi:filamentous hemagglutinin
MNRVARGILLCAFSEAVCAVKAAPPAPTQLPIPCQPGACGSNAKFVTSGAATAVAAGKNLTVTQSSSNATLNWASFNIGSSGSVIFRQPSATAVALNRIYDANPSSIFGSLSANGQIYLINANGFLFGAHSSVNVAGLIASSLNITDSTFTNGILAPVLNDRPALEQFTINSQNFAIDGPAGSQIPNVGTITVQNGAELNATGGGRLLLAAPTVQNYGSLSAPDGQMSFCRRATMNPSAAWSCRSTRARPPRANWLRVCSPRASTTSPPARCPRHAAMSRSRDS